MLKKLSIIVVITIVFLSSCFLEAPASVLGTLELNLDYSNSRGTTLLYGLTEGDVAYLTIVFTGTEDFTHTYTTAEAASGIEMLPGSYAATVTGYDADPTAAGVAIVSGTIASFTITTGSTTSASATLAATSSSTGFIDSLTVSWASSGITVITATASLIYTSTGTEETNGTLITSGIGSGSVTYTNLGLDSNGITSGDYQFTVNLTHSAGVLSVPVSVQVRDNIVTSGTITYDYEDFIGDTTGTVEITLTVITPADETINFTSDGSTALPDDEIYDNDTDTFNAYVQSGYTDYIWSLTGFDLSASDGTNNTTIDTTALTPGVYHLTVYVQSDGSYYSDTLRFIVVD